MKILIGSWQANLEDIARAEVCIVAALGAVLPHMDEELHSSSAEVRHLL